MRAKAKKGKAARTHQHQQSWGPREMNASKHRCLLAETYEKEEDDERLAEEVWIATEKFDGVRMRWEGHERGFTGRNGQGHFQPPDSFKALLPEEHLDGELWGAGRCRFSAVGSLQGTKGLGRRLHEMAWHSLTYVVFDAPQVAGPYMQRLEAARRALAAVGPPDGRIVVAPAVRVADATAKDALLQRVIAKRGEGLVLRRDEAWWRAGRHGAQHRIPSCRLSPPPLLSSSRPLLLSPTPSLAVLSSSHTRAASRLGRPQRAQGEAVARRRGCDRGPQKRAHHRQLADRAGARAQRAERQPVHRV